MSKQQQINSLEATLLLTKAELLAKDQRIKTLLKEQRLSFLEGRPINIKPGQMIRGRMLGTERPDHFNIQMTYDEFNTCLNSEYQERDRFIEWMYHMVIPAMKENGKLTIELMPNPEKKPREWWLQIHKETLKSHNDIIVVSKDKPKEKCEYCSSRIVKVREVK